MKHLLIALLATAGTGVVVDEGLDLSDPGQVSALYRLQLEMDLISDAVMGCMDGGIGHHECMCTHEDLFAGFASSVAGVLEDHPVPS